MADITITEEEAVFLEEDAFIKEVPSPIIATSNITPQICDIALMRAEGLALANHHRLGEGASFRKLAPDVDLIVVTGAQPLHHDRHIAGQIVEGRAVEHTWNYVVFSDEDQLLLCEVDRDIFEHIPLEAGTFIYFNTLNRHLVSRRDPRSQVVIAQVCGFGPDESAAAAERLVEVLSAL